MVATLTLIEDRRGLVTRPALGAAIDVSEGEATVLGRIGDVAVRLVRRARTAHSIAIGCAASGAIARAFGVGVGVDGAELLHGGTQGLRDGSVLGWPSLEIALRYDVVRERALVRRYVPGSIGRTPRVVLVDCAGREAPGRFAALLRSGRDVIERAHAVLALPDSGSYGGAVAFELERDSSSRAASTTARTGDEPALFVPRFREAPQPGLRIFDAADGAPLAILCARSGGLEPAVAVTIALLLARHLLAEPWGRAILIDELAISWDGDVILRPAIIPRRATRTDGPRHVLIEGPPRGVGLLVELVARAMPIDDRAREVEPAVRELLRRLIGEGAVPGEIASVDDAVAALTHCAHALRPIARDDLASVARGLHPDGYARELALREELALALHDDAGAALFR